MGKRRREDSEAVLDGTEKNRDEHFAKRVKYEVGSDDPDDDVFDVWLIKKPVKVSIDTLVNIKFPRAGKKKSLNVEVSKDSGSLLKCECFPAQSQMLHVPASKVRNQKDAMNMKALGVVRGVIFVSEQHGANDGFYGRNNADDGGALLLDESEWTVPLEIHSIRRKPVLPVENSKERLKAFGVIPKKKRRKLPNLA